MVKNAAAFAELRHLSRLGLPARAVMPLLLQTLHRVVPSATNLFDWVDADGQIVDYYTEEPYVPEAARLYFAEFYNRRDREVMPAYSERVRRGRGVIDGVAREPSFYRSDYYNLIWRPRGVHHSLEAVLRDRDWPIGALTLYRSRGDAPFAERDAQALAGIVPHLTRALTGAADYRGRYRPSGPSGLVVAGVDGRIVYLGAEGRRLLYLARRTSADTPADAAEAEEPRLPEPLIEPCRRLADAPHAAPTLEQRSAWGRFVFRLQRLEPSAADRPLIAIDIQRHVPVSLDVARALQALPLSPRQCELCTLLVDGHGYAAIAARMHITTHTAISYARIVYAKLGLAGRDELVRKLLAPVTSD